MRQCFPPWKLEAAPQTLKRSYHMSEQLCIPKRHETCWHQNINKHSSIINNTPKASVTQCLPTDEQVNKMWSLLVSCIIQPLKKEWSYSVSEPWKNYAKQNKPDNKDTYSIYIKSVRESRVSGFRRRREGNKSKCLIGIELLLVKMSRIRVAVAIVQPCKYSKKKN